MNPTQITERDKLELLKFDLDQRRKEINDLQTRRFHLFGNCIAVLPAAAAFVVAFGQSLLALAILALAGVTVVLIFWRQGWLIRRSAAYCIPIERRINELLGEEMMSWELRGARRSWFDYFYGNPERGIWSELAAGTA